MSRSTLSRLTPLVVSLAACTLAGCSFSAESSILGQFFNASRLLDNTSLQNFATVAFEPNAQGIITSFEIANVTPEQRKPLALKSLAQAHQDAKAADADLTKRKESYQNENVDAIRRVLKADRGSGKIAGKDAEVRAAWTKFLDDGASISRKVGEAKRKLASQTVVVDLSVNAGSAAPVDVTKYDGELVSKDVSVSARVKLPSGQTARKNLVITMQRAVLKGDKEITGRWIITAIKDGSGSPSTPRS